MTHTSPRHNGPRQTAAIATPLPLPLFPPQARAAAARRGGVSRDLHPRGGYPRLRVGAPREEPGGRAGSGGGVLVRGTASPHAQPPPPATDGGGCRLPSRPASPHLRAGTDPPLVCRWRGVGGDGAGPARALTPPPGTMGEGRAGEAEDLKAGSFALPSGIGCAA